MCFVFIFKGRQTLRGVFLAALSVCTRWEARVECNNCLKLAGVLWNVASYALKSAARRRGLQPWVESDADWKMLV